MFDDYGFMMVMRWMQRISIFFFGNLLCVIAGHSYSTLALYDTKCFCTKENMRIGQLVFF